MNRDDAVGRVKDLAATDKRPVIADATVQSVVDTYPIPDAAKIAVNGEGWAPTYDVMAATAEVWRMKAAQVAGDYNFTADDASYSKADVLAHCLEMEALYAAKAGSPSGLGTSSNSTMQVGSSVFGYEPRTYIDMATYAEEVLP